jgi:hypothetical protein
VALEEDIHHAILVRQRTGMRARGLLSRCRAPGLQGDDRQAACLGDPGQLGERAAVGDAFQIEQQQLDVGVLRDQRGQLADRDVGVVSRRVP